MAAGFGQPRTRQSRGAHLRESRRVPGCARPRARTGDRALRRRRRNRRNVARPHDPAAGRHGRPAGHGKNRRAIPVDRDRQPRGRTVGVMHACGHDGHTAILMGTAEVLMKCGTACPARSYSCSSPPRKACPRASAGGARSSRRRPPRHRATGSGIWPAPDVVPEYRNSRPAPRAHSWPARISSRSRSPASRATAHGPGWAWIPSSSRRRS